MPAAAARPRARAKKPADDSGSRCSAEVLALPPQSVREIARRESRAAQSWRTAAEALGEITPGCAVFCLTRGQWGMIDAILHVLDEIGPSDISLWTWTIAHYEVDVTARLIADGRLRNAQLILDAYAMRRTPQSALVAQRWVARFGAGSVSSLANHAKIARVGSIDGARKVLIRGSCNLNRTPHMEQIDLSEGGPAYDMVAEIEAGLPRVAIEEDLGVSLRASGLVEAHDPEFLKLFGDLKAWRA